MRDSSKTPAEVINAPTRDQRPGPDAPDQLSGDAGRDADRAAERQVGRTGLDGRVTEHVLHVEGEEEEDRHEAGEGDQLRDVGCRQATHSKDVQRQQRVSCGRLLRYERDEQQGGADQSEDGRRRTPTFVRCLYQREDQQQHRPRRKHGPDDIERTALQQRTVSRNQPDDADEHDRRDRWVDEEHPPPARSVGEEATKQHAGRGGKPADATPDAECFVPVSGFGEGGGQDRQRCREHECRAQALREPRRDQRPSLCARPPASDDTPISTVPIATIRFRPSRSARRPPSSMNPP